MLNSRKFRDRVKNIIFFSNQVAKFIKVTIIFVSLLVRAIE